MFEILVIVLSVISCTVGGYPDLTPEAITVYRNPNFFKNLSFGTKVNYYQKPTKVPQGNLNNYQYPGETKKPNPPPSPPIFEVNFDNSPEFQHEPRDIFVGTTYKPTKPKGPYSPKHKTSNKVEGASSPQVFHPVREDSEKEDKDSKENQGFSDVSDSEELQDFDTVLSPSPDEEFKAYHEPILLARPGFDPDESSGFASNTYMKPYAYNRTTPVSYDNWKFYNYPKIHSKEYLKVDSSPLYSEEPPSNAFEANRYPSNYNPDDKAEEIANFFENEYKNLGLDTKHIYKKLLNPKKSFSLKFHTKPKLKKLKLKLKKKHSHNDNWYDEYPFNF